MTSHTIAEEYLHILSQVIGLQRGMVKDVKHELLKFHIGLCGIVVNGETLAHKVVVLPLAKGTCA